MTRTIVALAASVGLGLAACSDDATPEKVGLSPAAASPTTATQPAPVPVPAEDAPEPVAADMPAVDPTAEPVDPDDLMKLRPD